VIAVNKFAKNDRGTPMLSFMYKHVAQQTDKNSAACGRQGGDIIFDAYTNGDILFTHSLVETLEEVRRLWAASIKAGERRGVMVVGKRTNVDFRASDPLDNDDEVVAKSGLGTLFQNDAEDYFIYSRGSRNWDKMPHFVVGRRAYDNWSPLSWPAPSPTLSPTDPVPRGLLTLCVQPHMCCAHVRVCVCARACACARAWACACACACAWACGSIDDWDGGWSGQAGGQQLPRRQDGPDRRDQYHPRTAPHSLRWQQGRAQERRRQRPQHSRAQPDDEQVSGSARVGPRQNRPCPFFHETQGRQRQDGATQRQCRQQARAICAQASVTLTVAALVFA
jgi:hypothetical protein